MDLGRFSVSLSVTDLPRARKFYETLGFEQVAGEPDNGWLILQSGDAKIGLFVGMFHGNLLTFNPQDARAIQSALVSAGYPPETPTEGDSGPAHFTIKDPDGNKILFDQH